MGLRKIKLSTIPRQSFSEGRSSGMGFAFAKRQGSTFVASQPLSACKDFLNDEVWSEVTGEEYMMFGQKSFKKNLFSDKRYAYMLISFLPNNGSEPSEKNKEELKKLINNKDNVQRILRKLDSIMKTKGRTIIELTDNPDILLVKMPIEYSRTSYAISLYTLVCRNGVNFTKDQKFNEYFKSNNVYRDDKYLLTSITKFLTLDSEKQQNIFTQSEHFIKGGPHNKGIVEYMKLYEL